MLVTKFVISLLLFLITPNVKAQLLSVNAISQEHAEAFIKSVPTSEFDKYVQEFGANEINENGSIDKAGLTAVSSTTEYKWTLENKTFYSYVKAFRTDLSLPPVCLSSSGEVASWRTGCSRAVSQFVQCHLFIISSSKKLLVVQPLYIPQPDFIEAKPACFDVYAMAPAKVVKDGMLIVAGYYDSRWTCNSGWYCASNSPVASPDPLYKTTFLIRFSEDEKGQLILSQDDKCMPLLNPYDTIDKARAVLKKNGCR